jgi:hypothetical protein
MASENTFSKIVPSKAVLAVKIERYLQRGGPNWDDILIHRDAGGQYSVALKCVNGERMLKTCIKDPYDAFVCAMRYKNDFIDESCSAKCQRCCGQFPRLVCDLRALGLFGYEVDYLVAQGKFAPGDTHFFNRASY